MKYTRFAVSVLFIAVIFGSCMGEPAAVEIVYDNRSDYVVKPLEDNAVDLNPGEIAAYRSAFINSSGSTVFQFGYSQNGEEFRFPDDRQRGPYMRIHPDETKTVVIYNGYYEIR
jgi:hypothetical protein